MKSSTQRWDKALYLVPTPIGNLADMSFRAIEALKTVDIIYCEDTRITGKLCQYYDISTPLKPYHDHSDDRVKRDIIQRLGKGERVALVSDAGTPMISDPGYKLVKECIQNGQKVIAIPGANAVLPALQMSTFPTDKFFFGGFLPSKKQERQDMITDQLRAFENTCLVYYESPKRLLSSLAMISDISSDIQVSVTREISKLHEETIRGQAQEVLSILDERDTVKGEIVLCLYRRSDDKNRLSHNQDSLVHIVQNLLKTMSVKDVSQNLANMTSMSKKEIYDLALRLKNEC